MASRHPTYKEMAIAAITNLKDRSGSSRQAISKYVINNYTVTGTYDSYLKQALKKLVKQKVLLQTKGSGASGSFRINPTSKILSQSKKPKVKESSEGQSDSTVAEEEASTSDEGQENAKKKTGAVKKLSFEKVSDAGSGEEPSSPVAKKSGKASKRHTVYEGSGEMSEEVEETQPKGKGKTRRQKK